MLTERTGGLKYNQNLQEFEEGRFRSFANFLNGNIANNAFQIIKMTTGLGTSLDEILGNKYDLLDEHTQSKISKEDWIDLQKGNLKATMTELLALMTVVFMLNLAMPDDDDEENPTAVRFRIDPTIMAAGGLMPRSYQKDKDGLITFDNYEIAHFRLLADANYLPYGRSYLEPARKIFKQLQLMEDAMLIHRIVRAPEKRTFFINVGNIPPNEVENYMQKTINKMKKTPYIDPKTGEYNLKYNIQNILEDFYIPVRGNDTSTKIETTKGLDYSSIEDIEYLREKLFAALRVPKAYLGFEADLSGKSTLAAEDIRFARTVERIQRIIVSELTRIAIVHLYAQGYDGESLTNFELTLTPPSIIYDQERIALLKEKTELATSMIDNNLLPSDWVFDNIFNFAETQYGEYRDLIIEDKKRKFRWSQIESEGNDPAETGEAFGTPHQLKALSVKGKQKVGGVPKGYDETSSEIPDAVLGRPDEMGSTYNTQGVGLGKIDQVAQGQMTLYPFPSFAAFAATVNGFGFYVKYEYFIYA